MTDDLFAHATEQQYGSDMLPVKDTKPVPWDEAPDEIRERFNTWKDTEGGNWVLQELYRVAARYGHRYQRTGQRVSVKLLVELLRDRIVSFKNEQKSKGRIIKKSEGYALNNSFTALIARHMILRRPQWDGMFEIRARDAE